VSSKKKPRPDGEQSLMEILAHVRHLEELFHRSELYGILRRGIESGWLYVPPAGYKLDGIDYAKIRIGPRETNDIMAPNTVNVEFNVILMFVEDDDIDNVKRVEVDIHVPSRFCRFVVHNRPSKGGDYLVFNYNPKDLLQWLQKERARIYDYAKEQAAAASLKAIDRRKQLNKMLEESNHHPLIDLP
jgi:hypothetical protein